MGNRACIYFFYDKEGVVDQYVSYMLDDLIKNVEHLFIVVNGKLNTKGRDTFLKYTNNLIVRDNEGLDVWAYKTALDYWGWEKISTFSELIMMNSTIMGPVYPFSEMFEVMDTKELDFWGITAFNKVGFDPFGGKIKYGYIPKHIQSHFISVRKCMLNSIEYQQYWNNMRPINGYEESVSYHESIFTKHFSDMGFKWKVYCDSPFLEEYTMHPVLFAPHILIKDYRCPIFKRRSFFHNYQDVLIHTTGEVAMELLEYLDTSKLYPLDHIWENLLRTCNMVDLRRNMQLNYVLSSKTVNQKTVSNSKVALIMHIYYADMIDQCLHYAKSMPDTADVFVTVTSEDTKSAVKHAFKNLTFNKLEIIDIQNRGRDVSALLVAAKDIIPNYDYICFAHDKKVPQLHWGCEGQAFAYTCFENILKNKKFVQNIIHTFDENEKLGMLVPPYPDSGNYYMTNSKYNWTAVNYENTKNLARELNITIPITADKAPVAPLGTMFWFKAQAFKGLLAKNWIYEDFPQEPTGVTDGTIMHALERIYAFTVQNEGYYVGTAFSDTFAGIRISSSESYLWDMNSAVSSIIGSGLQTEMISRIDKMNSAKFLINSRLKEKLPRPLLAIYKLIIKIYKKIFKK